MSKGAAPTLTFGRYFVDASMLWDFSYTSTYTPTAMSLQQDSELLTSHQRLLEKARGEVPKLWKEVLTAYEAVCARQATNPYSCEAQIKKLTTQAKSCNQSAFDHAIDAEMHW